MENIQGITDTSFNTGGSSVVSSDGGKFGDNVFLNLLVTELSSQTPLDPVDNNSFMQQMSTFSTMEEQKQLNDNLLALLDFQGVLARLQGLSEGSSLLGKEVTYTNADGAVGKGIVESVFVNESGEVRLSTGSEEAGMNDILGVSQPKSEGAGSEDSSKEEA